MGTLATSDLEMLYREKYSHVSRDKFDYFIEVADRVELDPWQDQIFCEMQHDHRRRASKLRIFLGITGARLIAERTGERDGADRTDWERDENGKLAVARVTVHRLTNGRRKSYTCEARMDEYYAGDVDPVWKQYPSVCLKRCAEMLALREAFPAELGAFYLKAEMPAREAMETQPVSQPLAMDRGTLQRFLIDTMNVTSLQQRAEITERLRTDFLLADEPGPYAKAAAAIIKEPGKYGLS